MRLELFDKTVAVASETRLSYLQATSSPWCHYAEFLLVSQEECDETRN